MNIINNKKYKQKTIYSNNKNDRGIIETSIDNDKILYQSEDGKYYEISIKDLIEYDNNDGEIIYCTNKYKQLLNIINKQNIQALLLQ